jgi:hypothetical protein
MVLIEDSGVAGFYAVLIGEELSTFWSSCLPPYSVDFPEDGCRTLCQNVSTYLPLTMASYPRKVVSCIMLLTVSL